MKITLAYGKTGIEIDVPEGRVSAVYRKGEMPLPPDPKKALVDGLENPIGSPPLATLAKGKKSACIAVCDNTRPVPNSFLLPPLIGEIRRAGIPGDEITILIATGTHRPNLGDELAELLGAEAAKNFRVLNHDCADAAGLADLGRTKRGTPVFLNRNFVEGELRIVTGLIEPHFMAGYSGGRKVVCPGLAGAETIRAIHSPALLESDRVANCVLDGNPLHEELCEIANRAGADFSVGVALDERRNIGGVFCGGLREAHRAGVEFVEKFDRVRAAEQADIVVTSGGGHPLDRNYYQAIKGVVGALGVLKPGGVILIAAECGEGMGSRTFVDCLKKIKEIGDPGEYLDFISRPENFAPDQWQAEMLLRALRRGRAALYSGGLKEGDFSITMVERAESIDDFISEALDHYGPAAKIAVIPNGPYVIPIFEEK